MAAAINVGELTEQVQIVELVETGQSESGQTAQTPTVRWQPWAKVLTLAGRKIEQARAVVALATHEVTIRYRPGVTPHMQVFLAGGRTLNIEHVNDVESAHVALILTCVEVK